MKNLFIVLVIAFAISSIQAQDESSADWILGGSLSYSFSDRDDYITTFLGGAFYPDRKSHQFSIRPFLGKQLNERWMLAFAPSYSHTTTTYSGETVNSTIYEDSHVKSNTIGSSVFARFVINPVNQFNLFLRPNASYSNGKLKTERADEILSETKVVDWSTGVGIGLLYNLSERFNITASIGGLAYTSNTIEDKMDNREDRKNNRFGFFINATSTYFGFEYKL